MKLWDASTGELVATLEAPAEGIGAVAFANDGRVVAAGGLDGLVRVFDAGSGELTATLAGHSDFVLALAFSPDGATLASASGSDPRPVRLEAEGDNEIILWDLATGARHATWELGGLGLGRTDFYSIAFSPDGTWLASGSGTLDPGGGIRGLLLLWDVDTGMPRPVFLDPPGAVLAVAFSPDGTRLAAGGFTRVVRIWNVDVIREAPASAPVPPSSVLSASQLRNWVYDLAFTVDGRTLVAASGDPTQPAGAGQIRLWDVDSGEPLGGSELDRGVKSLALSPDATMLVAGLIGGDARVYRLRQP